MRPRDLVVGMRAAADVAAAAAAATDRTLRLVDDLAGLLSLIDREDAATLLVVPGPELDVAGAMAIARTGATLRRPVGFLATWQGRESVERQLEKLRRPPRTGCDADLVFDQMGFAPLSAPVPADGGVALLSGTDDGLAERFSAPHRLLAVVAYGSAMDAEIGSAYVCGRADAPSWPCHLGGLCLERRRAGAGPEPPARTSSRDVAADFVLRGVCGAIALRGSVVDPRESVVAGLLASERCGPVIAPCKVTELDHALLLLGAAHARAGAGMGEVALQLNRASLVGASADVPWLLIGDPAARLAGAGQPPVAITAEGSELTAREGQVQLLRYEPEDAAVTWESGEDAAVLSRRLMVRQVPGTGHAVVLLASGAPVTLTVRARRHEQLPPELQQALSIWACAGPFAALRRLLAAAARVRDSPDAADLEAQLLGRSRSTWSHLGADARLRLLDQLTPSPAERAASERRRWAALHQGALEHLAALLERSPVALGYLHRTGTPSPAWLPHEDPCPYCGAPMEESRYRVDGAPDGRARIRCARCGPVSDAPATAGVVRIDVEGAVEPGGVLRWSITLPPAELAWRYRAATVAFEPVPWPLAEAATTTSGWHKAGDDTLSGCVTVRRGDEAPVAIGQADGDGAEQRRAGEVERRERSLHQLPQAIRRRAGTGVVLDRHVELWPDHLDGPLRVAPVEAGPEQRMPPDDPATPARTSRGPAAPTARTRPVRRGSTAAAP